MKLLRFFDRNRSDLALQPTGSRKRALLPTLLFVLMMAFATADADAQVDSSSASAAYLFAGFSGFIPFQQAYHLNYTTNLSGLPVEVFGGVGFPLNRSTWFPLTFRYIRRVATFVSQMDIRTLSIEPGVRVYLEKYQPDELRFFGGADVILARSTVSATIDASQDGTISGSLPAQHDYVNVGLGVDLGLSYPLGAVSTLDGGVHLGILLSNPVSTGGLGNVGGISVSIDYRLGF